jgi:uncharacterized protein YqeY
MLSAWLAGVLAAPCSVQENHMLRDRIDSELKTAMKARDEKLRVATLRLMNAAIKDRDIAARSEDRCEGVTDDEILGLLGKMVKQREESSATYDKAGRPELAAQERAEIEVIREFMPRQMSEAEVESAVADVVRELSASGLKDMGKVMSALKERFAGAMDFGKAGAAVKKRLA